MTPCYMTIVSVKITTSFFSTKRKLYSITCDLKIRRNEKLKQQQKLCLILDQ